MPALDYRKLWPLGADPAWIRRAEEEERQRYRQSRLTQPGMVPAYGTPTAPAAQAPTVAGAPGGTAFSGTPQFYGFGDYDAFQQQLFDESSAMLRSSMAAKGQFDSSMYGVALGSAAAGAQKTRWGLEQQEQARRTGWEAEQAIQDWREREAVAQRQFAYQQQTRNIAAQREQMSIQAERDMVEFQNMLGTVDQRDAWNLMTMRNELASAEPPGRQSDWSW